MFGPDASEGQAEHPELVELSRMKTTKRQKYQGVENLKYI